MYVFTLCVRYLRTRYIALASIISVMLGVATMIVVNSVLAGFTSEMRDRIHGFLADVLIESRHTEGIPDSQAILKTVEDAVGEYIEAATPTVEIPGLMRFVYHGQAYPVPVMLVGILPSGKAQVGPLRQYLVSYQPSEVDGRTMPPLRSMDDPVTWDLTPQAMERRRFEKASQWRQLEQHSLPERVDRPASDTMPLTPPQFDDDPAVQATDAATGVNAATDAAAAGPSGAEQPEEAPSFVDEVPLDILSDGAAAPVDDTAPLPARVFIGEGLISYHVRDPETGELQKVMMVDPGQDVTLTTVKSGINGRPETVSFDATVCDVFRSGMSEYDGNLVLMNLEQLQQNLGMLHRDSDGNIIGDAVTSIQIRLKDYSTADEVIRRLEQAFPPGLVSIKTWEAKQGLLLSAVELETAILNVLLFLIITVAGFGILAIFFMIVVEKTRDIGILKSLGAGSRGIMSIFLSYGMALGFVGSAAGVTLGLVFVAWINQIEEALSWITGRRVFDRDIYYFDSIPTRVDPFMVLWVAAGAMVIAILASVLPARRAARLHPVRALRFD